MQLKKTNIQGLLITETGTAYRKDLKIEIKPTAKGKVRFNGTLYDLQKLINYSKAKATLTSRTSTKSIKKKIVSIRELQKQGFMKTKIGGLYVSKFGKAYNYSSNRFLTAKGKGFIKFEGKGYNLAKLILETFAKIKNRGGRINFKNGNLNDYNLENLEYTTTAKTTPPSATDLIKCIRFYVIVPPKFNIKSNLFKFHLWELMKYRNFEKRYTGKDFEMFIEYSKNDLLTSNNQKTIFDKFNYTTTNGKNVINKYLNLLVTETMQDFENGILKIKDFAPKPPTKTETLRAFQNKLNEIGFNAKIPLRKKSNQELLKDFRNFTQSIKKATNPNQPPK